MGLLVEPVGGGSDVSSCWSWARASNASTNGDLILPLIGVVNSKTTEFKIGLHQKEGTQEIRKLEGEATAHQWSIFPEGFEEIPFGFEGSFQVKAAKSLEIPRLGAHNLARLDWRAERTFEDHWFRAELGTSASVCECPHPLRRCTTRSSASACPIAGVGLARHPETAHAKRCGGPLSAGDFPSALTDRAHGG